MIRGRVPMIVLLCCGIGIGRPQDPSTRPVPKDAPALLAASSAAVLATPALAFHCRYAESTTERDARAAEAAVVFRRGGADPALLFLQGSVSMPERFAFEAGLAGDRFLVVDAAKKTFESRPWPRKFVDFRSTAIEDAKRSLAYDIVSAINPMEEVVTGLNAFAWATTAEKTATLKGSEAIDGVLCDLVEVKIAIPARRLEDSGHFIDLPRETLLHRFAIGRGDLLPRRYAWRRPFMHSTSDRDPKPKSYERETSWELTKLKAECAVGKGPVPTTEGLKEGKVGSGRSLADAEAGGPTPGTGSLGGSKVVIGPMVGDQAPDFTVKDTAGKEYSLEKLKGKYLLVHFGKLDNDLDDDLLVAFKKRHGDKLILLDLVVGGDAAEVKKAKKALSFPRCIGGAEVATSWKLDIFPSAFFIGPDGKVAGKLPSGLRGADAKPLLEDFQRRTANWLSNPQAILGE